MLCSSLINKFESASNSYNISACFSVGYFIRSIKKKRGMDHNIELQCAEQYRKPKALNRQNITSHRNYN